MKLKTLKDCLNLNWIKVLLRAEFNVPLNENQEITDDTRIQTALPTIKYLTKSWAKIIICAHLWRPNWEIVDKLSLKPVQKRLWELLWKEIKFSSIYWKSLDKMIEWMKAWDILLLENIRFEKWEEKNDEILSRALASLADIYVSDAFWAVHRKHASTYWVWKILKSFAWLLIEKEIVELSKIFLCPKKPILAIIAGSKMETKIAVIDRFLELADHIIVWGWVANTLLKAKWVEIWLSLYEENEMERARNLIEKWWEKIILPSDAIVSTTISNDSKTREISLKNSIIGDQEKILDIWSETIETYSRLINNANTVVWNWPVWVYECKPFENGTKMLLKTLSDSNAYSLIWWWDTVDAMNKFWFTNFSHVSTGWWASLEFLEWKILPWLEILNQKS